MYQEIFLFLSRGKFTSIHFQSGGRVGKLSAIGKVFSLQIHYYESRVKRITGSDCICCFYTIPSEWLIRVSTFYSAAFLAGNCRENSTAVFWSKNYHPTTPVSPLNLKSVAIVSPFCEW